jgi:hypothetical protein
MSEIVTDPLSRSCYHLVPGPGIPNLVLLGAHARERSFEAARSGKSTDARCNLYLNFAADSLQIAQTVKGGSIHDCAVARPTAARFGKS